MNATAGGVGCVEVPLMDGLCMVLFTKTTVLVVEVKL